jgi:hypothetical protein
MSNMHYDKQGIVVRRAEDADAEALARLAALDSARIPGGELLVAETDARLLAALPLGSGRPIADPFEPTAELVAMLELRARQLRESERRGSRRQRSLRRPRPAEARS